MKRLNVLGGFLAVACASQLCLGADYYVDADLGDNSRDGTSPATARKTLASALTLLTANNDVLHFAKGDYLIEAEFTTALSGLTFIGSTGNADDVRINGQGANRFATFSTSGASARFESLTFTNCVTSFTWAEKGNPNVCHGSVVNFPNREGNEGAGRVFTNVVFTCNSNLTAYGACVYSCGSRYFDCRFERNWSKKGGAVCAWQNGGRGGARFTRTSFTGNAAESGTCCVNAVEQSSGTITFADCGFTNNQNYCVGMCSLATNCVFQSNYGGFTFGSAHSQRDFYACRFYDTTLCAFSVTQAGFSFYDCEFHRCGSTALVSGSRIENLVGCTFVANTNQTGTAGALRGDVGYMANCTFRDNTAISNGGAWYFVTYATDLGNGAYKTEKPAYVVTNCVFRNNHLIGPTSSGNDRVFGGAVCIGGESALKYEGPGALKFFDCEFTGNGATAPQLNYVHGGALFAPMGCRLVRCGFTNNCVKAIGGAFFGCATGGIDRCTFVGNSTSGGLYYGHGGALALMSGPTNGITRITETLFEDNESYGHGAAVCHRRGWVEVEDCRFEENRSTGTSNGGAYRMTDDIAPYGSYERDYSPNEYNDSHRMRLAVNRCVFTDNTADGGGGAMMLSTKNAAQAASGTVRNSLFVGNAAGTTGGAVWMENSRIVCENDTFVENASTGKGGAVYLSSTGGAATNCLFAANTAGEASGQYEAPNAVGSAGYCFATTVGGDIADGVNGCLVRADPLFTDAAQGDYTLRRTSPAVDAGLNADWMATATDLRNDAKLYPRILNNRVDIGCYEYRPVVGILLLFR